MSRRLLTEKIGGAIVGRMGKIVKTGFFINTYKSKGVEYAYVKVRFKIKESGKGAKSKWSSVYTLHDVETGKTIKSPVGIKNFNQLDIELKNQCWEAASALHQKIINNDTNMRMPSSYKNNSEAIRAYLDWSVKHGGDKTQANKAKQFIEYFGNKKLNEITKISVQEFLEWMIDKGGKDGSKLAFDTIRHRIAVASCMITFLKDRNQWVGDNPFDGVLTRHRRLLPERNQQKHSVAESDYEKLQSVVQDDRYKIVRHFLYISCCTGLREAELFRMDSSNIDRATQQWELLAKKGGKGYRRISIPRCLITYLDNEGVTGKLDFTGLKDLYPEARRKAGLPEDIKMKTLRKDFATRMRQAGATNDLIKFHQGRERGDVTNRDYLDDEESLKMTAKIIAKMFGEDKSSLTLISQF